jgi:hypothetical protein
VKILRALFLTLSLALVGFAAVPQKVEASPPTVPQQQQPQSRYYYVYYRVDVNSPWVGYGYTPNDNDAQWYANWISTTYGYESFVR